MTVAVRMSAEEFLALPEQPFRTELIEGEVVRSQPTMRHQRTLRRVLRALEDWCEAADERGTADLPVDVLLDDLNVYAPDISWYRASRAPSDDDPGPYPMPDIGVEVRSPSTWRYDVGAKKNHYERHGLPELWLVDTAADVVLIFRRSKPAARGFDLSEELARGDTLTSPLLAGFALAIHDVFG